jgi:hypothetical protein
MVSLATVLNNLGTGVLGSYNCSINGAIKKDSINNIIVLINSGVNWLYSEFLLNKRKTTINLVEDVLEYSLNSTGNLIEVLNVFYEGSSLEFVALDNETIQVPANLIGSIEVEATYKPVDLELYSPSELDALDPSSVDIDLPVMYLKALYYYIAQQWTISFDTGAGVKSPFHVGNNFEQLLDKEVSRLKLKGYEADVSLDHNKFINNGFI